MAAWVQADRCRAWWLDPDWRAAKYAATTPPADQNRTRAVGLPTRSWAMLLRSAQLDSKTGSASAVWSALRCQTVCGSARPSSAQESNFASASPVAPPQPPLRRQSASAVRCRRLNGHARAQLQGHWG